MRWVEEFNRLVPTGAERVVRRFAWHPISFTKKFNGEAYGLEYRWLEIVFIRQKWNESIFGGNRWFNVEFATKLDWLNAKIYE